MNRKGFTLVELLIVIALLGVLATAVLAAINPIEQINRSRDARMKSDSSQLLAAIDRYYASIQHFPWYDSDGDGTVDYEDTEAYGFISAQDPSAGICATAPTSAGCPTSLGLLISNNELKTEFTKRDFMRDGRGETDQIYLAKSDTTTSGVAASVYACYVPKSKSEQAKAFRQIALGDSEITETTPATCATLAYTTLATSCVVCLPE